MPVGECEAKCLVGQICGHGTVFVAVDVRRDADLYGLGLTQAGGQKCDLGRAVHNDPSNGVGRLVQLAGSCGHAMHDDFLGIHAGNERGRELAT
jgi:hypothetical protein